MFKLMEAGHNGRVYYADSTSDLDDMWDFLEDGDHVYCVQDGEMKVILNGDAYTDYSEIIEVAKYYDPHTATTLPIDKPVVAE